MREGLFLCHQSAGLWRGENSAKVRTGSSLKGGRGPLRQATNWGSRGMACSGAPSLLICAKGFWVLNFLLVHDKSPHCTPGVDPEADL